MRQRQRSSDDRVRKKVEVEDGDGENEEDGTMVLRKEMLNMKRENANFQNFFFKGGNSESGCSCHNPRVFQFFLL
ncbi:hypothetical protein CRE_24109 [Caenorhabditis remanei]|uniref:Uncharacterized protein n=1 Tax=Caenorhabditis remanei TaxID=31234 RepID=E3MVM2_CAERE|nr:hypothetical protein CRE_24109 [Caenorhabditis remanei]